MPSAKELYLDLLKQALTFNLWDEPPQQAEPDKTLWDAQDRPVFEKYEQALKSQGLQIVKPVSVTPQQREEGLIWPGYADSMIGMKRMDNVKFAVETVLAEQIPGDVIEAGVWRGGASIFMRGILAAHGITDRKVYVADSFAGLPKPDPATYPADEGDTHHTVDYLAVSLEQVQNNFKRYHLLDDQVVFLQGWFSDILPSAPMENISVLRADGDMYSSTIDILNNLYPKLSPGGFCIIDDYGAIPACKKAVDDYRRQHQISDEMIEIDWTGLYWREQR